MVDVTGFSISDLLPVAGRTVVVHDSAKTKTGCGLLRVTTGQVTPISVYPGFAGSEAVVGLIVTEDAASGILMSGTLGGLPASVTAGFHIHSGYTCDDGSGVGGHYFDGLPTDPWTTTYTSDASGAAQISLPMSNFSLYSSFPVLSRAIVVHSTTAKIGCGVTSPAAGPPVLTTTTTQTTTTTTVTTTTVTTTTVAPTDRTYLGVIGVVIFAPTDRTYLGV